MTFIQQIFKPLITVRKNLKLIENQVNDLNTTISNEINEAKKTTLVKDFGAKVKEIMGKYKNIKDNLLKEKIETFQSLKNEKKALFQSTFISTDLLTNIFKDFTMKNPNYFLKVLNYPQEMNYPNSNTLTLFSENYLCLVSKDFPESYLNKIQSKKDEDMIFKYWNSIKKDSTLSNKIFPLFKTSSDKLLIINPIILNALVDFPIFNYFSDRFLLNLSKADIEFLEQNIYNKNINLRKQNKVLKVFPEIQTNIENCVLKISQQNLER